jgi:hypothetical protein
MRMNRRSRATAGNYAHGLPVIGKFAATIQAHCVCSRLRCSLGPALSLPGAERKAHVLVPATKERIKDFHCLLQNLRSKTISEKY